MTKLYENIKLLCREQKISILGLERILDIPKNTISGWRLKLPAGERILSVAHYFDVSVDFLVGNTNNRISHKADIKESSLKVLECVEKLDLDEKAVSYLIETIQLFSQYY